MNYLCIENLLVDGPGCLANSEIEQVGRYVKFADWLAPYGHGTKWAFYDPKANEWKYIKQSPVDRIENSRENRHRIVDCNECKHRLACLVQQTAHKSFEQR